MKRNKSNYFPQRFNESNYTLILSGFIQQEIQQTMATTLGIIKIML